MNYYGISKILFYGNRLNRPCVRSLNDPNGPRDTTNSTNLVLNGQGFVIDEIQTAMAVCASGASIEQGSDYTIQNSWFTDNGTTEETIAQRGSEPWSDGLTVLSCANGFIQGNHFIDNTDIDLIASNTHNCLVSDNFITHFYSYAYAGLMVAQFGPADGSHTGTLYTNNVISSLPDMLGHGIMIGNHPWDYSTQMDDVGTVQGNTASGAFFNLTIEADSRVPGVAVGVVTGNVLLDPQGVHNPPRFGPSCATPTNYVVNPDHAGLIVYELSGLTPIIFDSQGGCALIQ